MTAEQPVISAPIPTTGPQTDARYYLVMINGESYSLHDEWGYGVYFQGTSERWEGDVAALDEELYELRLALLRLRWSEVSHAQS